jgi:hypothetical protein
MYPKRFTLDRALVERACVVTLRSPNLNVLRDDNRAEMPGIAHFLEDGFKARDKQGKLLLPDLSALLNTTIGIFSDYGGEDPSSRYSTYSFLVCAYGSLGPFKEKMTALRATSGIGQKEIAFKDFRHGPSRRMLPAYLRLTDQYISGLLFTLVVDKSIPSLFGPGDSETLAKMADALETTGYGALSPKIAEKLFRIVHCIAFLIALLGHPGQKIFWMMDNDPIGETSERHTKLLGILLKVLPLYTTKSFGFLGGARPFTPPSFELLDLLSMSDIAAGAVAQCMSSIDTAGQQNALIKPGGDHVLRWLCHNSVTLKKFAMAVKRLPNGVVGVGPIDFEARAAIPDELFIPTQLVR